MNHKLLVLFAVLLLVINAGCLSTQDSLKATSKFDYAPSLEKGGDEFAGLTNFLERKIISTAHLQIEVKDVQTAFNEIAKITQTYGGFISGSSVYDTGSRKNGQMTVRVPQKDFYSAVERIEALGTVRSRQVSGQDVTEEYIDIEARLGNLKKQEVRLQEILKMANIVKDVLEVERELERVRGEIERLTGRLNYLNQSVEMSTITVTAEEPAPITGEEWGITDALREAVRGFVESVKGIMIFTGYILPILIFVALVILIALGIKRRILPRFKA